MKRIYCTLLVIGWALTAFAQIKSSQDPANSKKSQYPFIIVTKDTVKNIPVFTDKEFYNNSTGIIFQVNKSDIHPNDPFLETYKKAIIPYINNEHLQLRKVFVRGAASPEGPYENNKRLGKERTSALLTELQKDLQFQYKQMDTEISSITEDYGFLCVLMENALDPDYPLVKEIYNACGGNELQCKQQLMKAQGGKLWKRLTNVYFPQLRAARVILWFSEPDEDHAPLSKVSKITTLPVKKEETPVYIEPAPAPEPDKTYQFTEQSITALRHYKEWDNWFVNISYGGNVSLSENWNYIPFTKMVNPTYGFSFGKWVVPAMGFRFKANYQRQSSVGNWEAIQAYPEFYGNGKYTFNTWAGTFDVLMNLHNLFKVFKEDRVFNLYSVLGMGFERTFSFAKKVHEWKEFGPAPYVINTRPKNYLMCRVGIGSYWQLSQAWDFNLEFDANITNDKYNGVVDDQLYDTFLTLEAGFTYHFKDHFGDRRFKYRKLTDRELLEDLNDRVNAARRKYAELNPEVNERIGNNLVELELLDMSINFSMDATNVPDLEKGKIEDVAKYMQENPDVIITVAGCADATMNYSSYNQKLAQRRAVGVYNYLVKNCGIDPRRLKITYKAEKNSANDQTNDWKHVVLFIVEHYR